MLRYCAFALMLFSLAAHAGTTQEEFPPLTFECVQDKRIVGLKSKVKLKCDPIGRFEFAEFYCNDEVFIRVENPPYVEWTAEKPGRYTFYARVRMEPDKTVHRSATLEVTVSEAQVDIRAPHVGAKIPSGAPIKVSPKAPASSTLKHSRRSRMVRRSGHNP